MIDPKRKSNRFRAQQADGAVWHPVQRAISAPSLPTGATEKGADIEADCYCPGCKAAQSWVQLRVAPSGCHSLASTSKAAVLCATNCVSAFSSSRGLYSHLQGRQQAVMGDAGLDWANAALWLCAVAGIWEHWESPTSIHTFFVPTVLIPNSSLTPICVSQTVNETLSCLFWLKPELDFSYRQKASFTWRDSSKELVFKR